MKVCVYAISKNEEKNADKWAHSMSEADEVYVLDTGSTDRTVQILKENGVNVAEKSIIPWRFDNARNLSLELVPEDAEICVCTDLDEEFEPGWRKILEEQWTEETTRAKYRYTWNFLDGKKEGTVFYADKIHSRKGYKWVNPVHEVLASDFNENIITAEGIQLNHHADFLKDRSQYLPLLELAVKENPENDRNVHYLGREYMFKKRYGDAIKTLKHHLEMKNSTWKDERSASMRYIARCYEFLNKMQEAYDYRLMAILEAPYLREPWIEMADFEYRRENYYGAIYFTEYALKITERAKTYMTEPKCWNEFPYDILSVSYFYTSNLDKAIINVKKAIEFSTEKRLKDNLELFEKIRAGLK